MQVPRLLIAVFSIVFLTAQGQDYRLPETVWPSKYEVDLVIPSTVFTGQTDTFEGEVTIHFTVSNATSEIKLHHRVNITTEQLSSGNQALTITNSSYDSVTEILTLEVNELSPDVEYQLYFQYNATFETTAMRGFYTSTYNDEDGNAEWLVTTQFQPTSARHGFPCFDEPQFKATFAISLTYPTGLTALSNTNSENDTAIDDTYTKSTYQETAKMSTYLIAFIISNFTCTEGYTIETGVSHRVCSRRQEEENRQFALEAGTPLLRTLESITGIKYGSYMPKMDQMAIPDFSAGAMENWGLVTYRETGLLYSDEDTNCNYKESITLVIAHEFTHMWFGNLITCKWWDYTFLNEGFARFYQYFSSAATKQFVDWEFDKLFNVEQVHTALLADSVASAQALTSPSASPSEVSNKFSTISYNKGASIYRMIETNIMGADNFIYGIRDYLDLNRLGATVPSDLWSSLAKFVPSNALPSGVTLEEVLENWVEYNGHPVVQVTSDGDDVVLTQERFLLYGNDSRQYYVPITYTTAADPTKFSNKTVKAWLTPNGESLRLEGVLSNDSWIILNNRQSGFYRVEYDDTSLALILAQLHNNHLAVDVLNRAQIVSDAYNFARSGRYGGYGSWNYRKAMEVLSYLHHEVDYYPWYAAIVGNNHLLLRIGLDTDEGQQFITWMLGLMEEVYQSVPFDTVDPSNQIYSLKQAMILAKVCQYGEETCVTRAKEIFADYRDNGIKVPKDLRRTVYCTAMRYSDDAQRDYDFLWQKYTETSLMNDILTIFLGVGCAQDVDVLKGHLAQTINSTSGIRYQDFSTVWSYVYTSSKNGTIAALEFIAENYSALNEAYASVGSLITTIASYIYDSEQVEKLEALGAISEISDAHKTIVETAITTANENIENAAALKEDVAVYLTGGVTTYKSSLLVVLGVLFLQKLFL